MPRPHHTNDYFLTFAPEDGTPSPKTLEVNHPDIPPGFTIYEYREVYIPAYASGQCFYRGAGTNPHTMQVPINFRKNHTGLLLAIHFCKNVEEEK